jgi:transcriptional activator for dhaKLM operon
LLAVVGPAEGTSSHTIGLVMTAARAISNQIGTDWYVEEANRHLSELRTILGAISEGIVAWNEAGVITHVNAPAAEMLRVSASSVVGRPIETTLDLPTTMRRAASEVRELHDVETTLRSNGTETQCLANIRLVYEGENHIGYVAMLRPMEHVRRLVHQQIGVRATLHLDDIASSAQSAEMRPVLRQARAAARGTAPVLLRGEGGAGKNYLARAIHNDGSDLDSPFIVINCQAIPHELMISEFMGYDETSAQTTRPSKFELANHGTLLLDHVEYLSLEMQAAVLNLIETGQIMRLGGARPIPVSVRIIAATTADLEGRVREGSFLPHLYYRFGVFTINMPPLRERAEDIPLLAERFLARMTRQAQRATWIEDEAMNVLRRYPWPGNVRELESALERALHQSDDHIIHAINLPLVVRQGRVITGRSPQPKPVITIAEAEREAIIRAGRACEGQVTEMAQQLGIGRTTLWRKLKRLNLEPKQFK